MPSASAMASRTPKHMPSGPLGGYPLTVKVSSFTMQSLAAVQGGFRAPMPRVQTEESHRVEEWNRTETWLILFVLAIGLVPLGIAGLWVFMSATATPLHPNPQAAPSVTRSTPLTEFCRRRRAGKHIVVRPSPRNLPGLSVAVGIGGDIVGRKVLAGRSGEARDPSGPR